MIDDLDNVACGTDGPSSCLYCLKTIGTKKKLARHLRELHGEGGFARSRYICSEPGCSRSQQDNGFPRLEQAQQHFRNNHSSKSLPKRETDAGRYKSGGTRPEAGRIASQDQC
ncbi:predicted protein [Verticillium alfalfae VaMs.102]|uniref:Predicted protein n=1 Tax=Verticillium alfalfae (strain VaMs.102 / ATCC MYA-4576 / FGSC 10136) TaxID=526221 RepID=C9SVS1_VERA1|nr:predicted protein [Verticillium alfalfae VaMs.102]EEY22886.1 predicted protein [Verticillium alfalfae VaMs.102]